MAKIILRVVPAWENGVEGLISFNPFAPALEQRECATIAEAQKTASEMIARAKQAGKHATILATAIGRKPNGWKVGKYSLEMTTF